jgi:hypothetical protein
MARQRLCPHGFNSRRHEDSPETALPWPGREPTAPIGELPPPIGLMRDGVVIHQRRAMTRGAGRQ